jgi:hypothetical protein
MEDPADLDSTILMGIRAAARGDQFAAVERTFLAQLRGVVVRVAEDVTNFQRQLSEQSWRDPVVGLTGNRKLGGERNSETPDGDGQMQLPAVPPAVITGLAPGGLSIDG